MTRNNILNKTKSKIILALLIICVVCMSLFTFTACSNTDTSSDTNPSYSYSEKNETLISNSYFSYGTADVKLTAYPKTSVTGWTKKTETDMTASSSKYGVIDVSNDGWTNLVSKLYDDTYFLNFFKIKYDFEESDVKTALNKTNPTSAEIEEYIIDNYFNSNETFKYPEGTSAKNQFKNPGTHDGATDSKIYMLNNYLSKDNVGRGTAQKITSSSTITLNKGEYGKVSVWVKTQNVSGLGVDYGANIRLQNTFNSNSQAEFGIYNIVDTEWTKYTIYVKADETYSTTFTLVLGLGADKFSSTEGTVYFDDVEFTHVTPTEYATATKDKTVVTGNMNYGSSNAVKIDSTSVNNTNTVALYDMSLNTYLENNASSYKKTLDISSTAVVANYTVSNKVDENGTITGGRFDDENNAPVVSQTTLDANAFPYVEKALKASLNKASYTLSFKNAITVNPEQYAYIELYVKNGLEKFGSTSITIDVFDKNGEIVKKRAAIASLTEASDDWAKLGIIIKNNFTTGSRQFTFDIVIGPSDVALSDYVIDYATGEVLLTQPTISTGSINQYVDESKTEETENYKLYSLFSSAANGTTALYAGSANDYTDVEDETETYDLSVAPSDEGTITTKPAIPKGYTGIVSNHFYITDAQDAVTSINTSTTSGLINTKYLNNYSQSLYGDIKSKLNGAYETDEDIQPLMIYNPTATQYGYIGESKLISASSYAKFEITLRVVDSAKAFVYLVDTQKAVKEVVTFEDFTVNSDAYGNAVTDGKTLTGSDMKLEFAVTSDMMDEDGWVTLEFYVATGANAKNVRLEVWNGSRDGATSSTGHVFVKSIHAHTSSGFTESSNSKNTWTESGNALYEIGEREFDELYIYKRPLTETEKKFNAEQTDSSKKVSYEANYVWGKSDTIIYAVYNTIDPVEVDPYEATEDEEETETSGCAAETDPSTFWLSFSSILLGVALAVAIIMLVIKNVVRRRRANASDAKSHYKVTSRVRPQKKQTVDKTEEITETEEASLEEEIEEVAETEETETADDSEQTLDEYVYGDVQDFGEDDKESSDKQSTDSPEENN